MEYRELRRLQDEMDFIYDSLLIVTDLEKIELIERLNEIDAILETEQKKIKAKECDIKRVLSVDMDVSIRKFNEEVIDWEDDTEPLWT